MKQILVLENKDIETLKDGHSLTLTLADGKVIEMVLEKGGGHRKFPGLTDAVRSTFQNGEWLSVKQIKLLLPEELRAANIYSIINKKGFKNKVANGEKIYSYQAGGK